MGNIKLFVFRHVLQNCSSLHGDGHAYIAKDPFYSFTPTILEKLDAINDYQGELYSSYGSKMPSFRKALSHFKNLQFYFI